MGALGPVFECCWVICDALAPPAELGDPGRPPLPLAEAVVCAARLRPGEASGLPQVLHAGLFVSVSSLSVARLCSHT